MTRVFHKEQRYKKHFEWVPCSTWCLFCSLKEMCKAVLLWLQQDSELSLVDADLALQRKIFEAARKLCEEERLSKAVKKSRLLQYKREEKKLKRLQELAFQLRLERGRSSPLPALNASQGKVFLGDFFIFTSVLVYFFFTMYCFPLLLYERCCFDFQIWVHQMTALCLILWCRMRVRTSSWSRFLLQFVSIRSTISFHQII